MDISAQGDHSILLWYEDKTGNGLYEAIIASDYSLYANKDCTNAFAYIAYDIDDGVAEVTDTLVNIELLNMNNVTNMNKMFVGFGSTKMEEFDLGSNFNTHKVTSMNTTFYLVGSNKMTRFNLGSNFNTSNVTNMYRMFKDCGRDKLESLDLSICNFDTSKVTSASASSTDGMVEMFYGCGQKSMTTFELGDKFTTKNIKSMQRMFCRFGNALTEFDLTKYDFDTSNVRNMHYAFGGEQDGGTHRSLQNVKTFNVGDQFDTSQVTTMAYMFHYSLENVETFELGDLFNTSNVTGSGVANGMSNMFDNFAINTTMTSFDLGKYIFDTSKVQRMSYMFQNFAMNSTTLKSMNLGDKFRTDKCEAMANMFSNVGRYSMEVLDLGPAFNHIASVSAGVFGNSTGKSGCIIYVGEAVFDEIEGWAYDEREGIELAYGHKIRRRCHLGGEIFNYTRGTVKCKYYSNITSLGVEVDEVNNTLKILLKGEGIGDLDCIESGITDENATEKIQISIRNTASETPHKVENAQIINGESTLEDVAVEINLGETVELTAAKTGTLADGTEVTIPKGSIVTRQTGNNVKLEHGIRLASGVILPKGTIVTLTTTPRKTRYHVIQEIIVESLSEETLQDGEIYLHWSGMATVDITRGTLCDKYGNGNINTITLEDTETTPVDRNTNGRLFLDLVDPVLNYKYAWIDEKMPTLVGGATDTSGVDQGEKALYLQVEAIDKYMFKAGESIEDKLDASKVTVVMDGVRISNGTVITQDGTVLSSSEVSLSVTAVDITRTESRDESNDGVDNPVSYVTGAKFTLKVTGLQQIATAYIRDYSGYVSLVLDGAVKDLSGNGNVTKTITIGVDNMIDEDLNTSTTPGVVDVVSPTWTVYNSADIEAGVMTVQLAATDKYFKNVLKTTSEIASMVQLYVDGSATASSATVTVTAESNIYMDEYKTGAIHDNGQNGLVGKYYTFKITSSAIKTTSKQIKLTRRI